MATQRSHFPWRLYRKYLYRLAIPLLICALVLDYFDSTFKGMATVMAFTVLPLFAFQLYRLYRPLARLRQSIRSGEYWFSETSELSEDEPEEWAEVALALQKLSSQLASVTERTDQEESEIKTLMQSISDAVIAVDRSGQPLFSNHVFDDLFGELSFIRAPEVLAAFQTATREGESSTPTVSLYVNRETLPRHFTLSIAPLKIHDWSQTYGAIGIFHDVTDLKRADQIRMDFVANVSHEIRTPLTAIKGYNEVLVHDLQSSNNVQCAQYLKGISRNVDRMTSLVNDLLDLSDLESGAELETEVLNPREITESVLRNFESQREEKEQTITWDCQVDSIFADEQRVEQVLTNLIQNAIKYTPIKSQIQIKWYLEGKHSILSVIDNGPGIREEHLPRIFERFYRVDKARSREMGGTGLGLSIVKHIMRRHSGSAEVRSVYGKGAEFVCRFPTT